MASILGSPYVAFGLSLLGGGEVDDAFSAFQEMRNFQEQQKNMELQRKQLEAALQEANRQAQYRQQIDQAVQSAGGDMQSLVQAIQPLVLGMTGDIGAAQMPVGDIATIMDDPYNVSQVQFDPFTGQPTQLGSGYSDYKQQMDYLGQQLANQKEMAAIQNRYRMGQIGAQNKGQLDMTRLEMLDKLPEGKLAAIDRAKAIPQFFGEGPIGAAIGAVASQLNLTEDQSEIEINRILRKFNDWKLGTGPEPTAQEKELFNALSQYSKAMSPEQSMEAAMFRQMSESGQMPMMQPSDYFTGDVGGGMSMMDQQLQSVAPENLPQQPGGGGMYDYGGANYPARPDREEEKKGMLQQLLQAIF